MKLKTLISLLSLSWKGKGLRKFNLRSMKQHGVVAMCGKRHSGKTVLIKDIMYNFREKIPSAIVLSDNERICPEYSNHIIPNCYAHEKCTVELLNNISSYAKRRDLMFICDNCYPEPLRFQEYYDLCENASRDNLMCIYSNQLYGCMQKIKRHIDYMFLFCDRTRSNLKEIWKLYVQDVIPDVRVFFSIFDAFYEHGIFGDHRCLVIDFTKNAYTTPLRDRIFWYKAEMRCDKDWRFGSRKYWRSAEKYKNI